MDIEKKLEELHRRVGYAKDILGGKTEKRLSAFERKLEAYCAGQNGAPDEEAWDRVKDLEAALAAVEEDLDSRLTPMDKVRIVRHPQRITLKDILENVYDNYTEIGGRDENSIDPAMLIARAYITRRVGKKILHQPVMVVGQEKGHGQEFRNGGSVKPWGNYNALKYMKVAARENIPIHSYVFTPGSYPIEDFPGAAQQIAENIYEMAGLPVPVITVFSEGGSGGAEAIAVADKRMMLSHGYYSVISPEGAAAIEGRIKPGQRASAELIDVCACNQKITAQDNLAFGYIDEILQEPPLGARQEHFEFFKRLRAEVIRATDEVVLSVRGLRLLRKYAIERRKGDSVDHVAVRWKLNSKARQRLLWRRYRKYRGMAQHAFEDRRTFFEKLDTARIQAVSASYAAIRYGLLKKYKKKIFHVAEEASLELQVVTGTVGRLTQKVCNALGMEDKSCKARAMDLTGLSDSKPRTEQYHHDKNYTSSQARQDRDVSCPNAPTHGCMDIWARDLFGDYAGVCPNCGHHLPLEYQWYLAHLFDWGTVREFNRNITAGNPTGFPGFEERLVEAKSKTGLQSACLTFEAKLKHIRLICGMLVAPFRGGSVGAAEGEKFIRALERAGQKHLPFLAYVHGTAGIRIHEGTNGLIQMPRVTMAVRRYIEAGGLYIVLYDTNSYAGPVASFLGCSPYQYAVRSSRIGFAGPGVIKETTGLDIPPDYHSAQNALSRGHIQDIWDRPEIRRNLQQALMTLGGRVLYYR